MNTNRFHTPGCRMLVVLLSVSLLIAPAAGPAYAVATPLADIPIASKVTAKPNIVYTLDDSGSMQYNYLPDWVIGSASNVSISKITRVGTVATATVASTAALVVGQFVNICCAVQPEYNGSVPIKTIPNGTTFTYDIVGAPVTPATVAPFSYQLSTAYCRSGTSTSSCSVGGLNTFTSPPFYAASFNHMMYDPNVNYTPPVKYDGTPLTHTIGTDTDALGNQNKFNNVQTDPFTSVNSHADLTVKVAVPLYCNTDWPLTKGGVTSSLTIADVGDANGEYKAGTGDWCRINGTKYDASVASGAPAVLDDYNYPYQSSSGATGTQYFYKLLSNKILYCDRSSPYWPRTTNTIIGCTAGGTPTCGGLPCTPVTTGQTCNLSTPGKTCNPTVALRNFTPAVCKTPNALYCLPNVGGSDGNSPGTGTAPECLPCTCNADYQPASTKKCSVTGAACTTVCGTAGCNLAECPNQVTTPNPNGCSAGAPIYSYVAVGSPSCTAQLWDPVANVPMATTLLQDSNAQGYVCRHNNQVYAVTGVPAAGTPFTYPRINLGDVYAANKTAPFNQLGHFGTGAQGYSTGSSCPTIGTTISIPRHYYTIDSVAFCDVAITTANAQWRGFGTGVCKPANDLTQFQNVEYGQFHRASLINDGRTFPYTDQALQIPLTRTYAQEIINYANWFAYYRLRAHAAKTTSSLAFNSLDDTYRVGFHTLGSEPIPIGTGIPITWVDVADFKSGAGQQRNLWWNALFAVPTVTNYKTPSLSAMLRVGNLFETGGASGLPGTIASLPAGTKDPIKDASGNLISCASNYHILFTDGFTNQIALPAVAGDTDQAIPGSLPPEIGPPTEPDKVHPGLNGALWPKPFLQGAPAVADTLSDIATYYWARDLRPGLTDDVPAWSGKPPNDVDPAKDIAWWQHVQFSAISFGSAGTLDADNQSATLANIVGGSVNWPNLTVPNNPPLPAGNKGAVAIDDLWHATVNSRGTYVFATSPLEVQYGLGAILAGISNQRKSRSGAAFNGQVLSTSNDIIYEPTIEMGWGGDILKVQIDSDPLSATAGQELATLWRAASVLANQIKPAFAGDEPWMNETKRRIVTWSDGGVPVRTAFRATAAGVLPALTGTQLGTMSANSFMQRRMVAYLRGGTTYTTVAADPVPVGTLLTIEGTGIGQFRKRLGGALGDVSNAQPLVVSAPTNPPIFNTGADPGYAAYITAQAAAGYQDRVVAAANDGMVHIFDSADGHEIFAYVPSTLMRNSVDASGRPTGIQALTFQDGGAPIYHHHFYVDSSPRTADIDTSAYSQATQMHAGSGWKTVVVGGLGKGGNTYYALDLTDGNAANESQAAAKLMWEYSDPDWRYTYGRPIIVKTYAYGWTVIVTSGYNNVSGEGRIYLLDPRTGKPHNPAQPYLTTGPVTCNGPDGLPQTSGLTQINGFTKNYRNQFTEQVYGGDLCGNVWRFDLTSPTGAYPAPQLFAILTDAGGSPQPITTAPQIEIDLANGVNRYVFFGTGRLLDVVDFTVPAIPQQQTMYAIRDGKLTQPIPDGDPSLPIRPRCGTCLVTLADATPFNGAAILGGAPDGWYHDLPDGSGGPAMPAERIVIDNEADVNTVTYIGTQVQNDPCTIALPANIYAREYATAASLVTDPNTGLWYYHDKEGGVGSQVIGLQNQSTGEITLGVLLSHEVPGTKPIAIKNPATFGRNRMSWRLLTGE